MTPREPEAHWAVAAVALLIAIALLYALWLA